LTVDKDGNKKYVPAWVFVEYEDYDDPEAYRNGEYPIRQLAYINAIDGTYIDIYKNAKTLGMIE
jgi:hypothetical protein